MAMIEISALLLVLLAVLLAGGVWIAISLMACGWVAMQFVAGGMPARPRPLKVESTQVTGHVDHLADEVQAGDAIRGHGAR